MACLEVWKDCYLLIYMHHGELMKSFGSHANRFSWLLMALHDDSDGLMLCAQLSKVTTTPIVYVTFKAVWSFFCSLREICVSVRMCIRNIYMSDDSLSQ
jgi:hypothetical protein